MPHFFVGFELIPCLLLLEGGDRDEENVNVKLSDRNGIGNWKQGFCNVRKTTDDRQKFESEISKFKIIILKEEK